MREAIGEANITVITIILIGTILPVFYLVVPRILTNIQDKACCISNNGVVVTSGLQTECQIVEGKEKSDSGYIDKKSSEPLVRFNEKYCK